MSIGADHRKAVRIETAISGTLNGLVPPGLIRLLEAAPPQTLFGEHPLVLSLLPAAGLATTAMSLIVTTIVRARRRAGSLPALVWNADDRHLARRLPANIVLRAVTLGLLAVVLLVPPGLIVAALLGVLPMTRTSFLIFNIGFGVAVGVVMARYVVLAALADPVRE